MGDLATLDELCAGRPETPDAVRELMEFRREDAYRDADDAGREVWREPLSL